MSGDAMGMTKEERSKALHTGSEIEQYVIIDCQHLTDFAKDLEYWLTHDRPTPRAVSRIVEDLRARVNVLQTHVGQQDFVRWLRHRRRQARGNKRAEN